MNYLDAVIVGTAVVGALGYLWHHFSPSKSAVGCGTGGCACDQAKPISNSGRAHLVQLKRPAKRGG